MRKSGWPSQRRARSMSLRWWPRSMKRRTKPPCSCRSGCHAPSFGVSSGSCSSRARRGDARRSSASTTRGWRKPTRRCVQRRRRSCKPQRRPKRRKPRARSPHRAKAHPRRRRGDVTAPLLDPAFARELEALRRRMRVVARSGGGGDHLAKKRGGSAEFLEHRPYAPGDDLRRIDWLAFARTGEPVFKLFRAEEDIVVRLVVDASASLDHRTPTQLLAAKRLAASIRYIALGESERAQLLGA